MTDTTTPDTPNCPQHGPMAARTDVDAATWQCSDPVCTNAVWRPADGVTPRGSLEITHTRADGTLVEGSRKGDGVYEIVRAHGFRFFPSLGCLGVRQSRDKAVKRWYVDGAAAALRDAGWTVAVSVDEDTRRTFAEAEADRVERAQDRAARFTGYAGNAASRSAERREAADRIGKRFEFGQPILLGHHSQRRAERDHERMDQHMRASFAEADKAKHYAQRAAAAGSYEEFRKNPPRTLRRIEKLEAERRGVQRWLDGDSNNGYTVALTPSRVAELNRRLEELDDELGVWKHVVEEAEKAGTYKVWGPDDFTKGDFARIRGRWYEVLRVNKKTLTVPGGPDIQRVISLETHAYPGMRSTSPYNEVSARKSAEEMRELLVAAQAKAAEEGAPASS